MGDPSHPKALSGTVLDGALECAVDLAEADRVGRAVDHGLLIAAADPDLVPALAVLVGPVDELEHALDAERCDPADEHDREDAAGDQHGLLIAAEFDAAGREAA